MAINFNALRSRSISAAPTTGTKEERPKSEYWVNVGYSVEVEYLEDGEKRTAQEFVSLPIGLPIGPEMKKKPQGSDPIFLAKQTARNELLEQLLAHAAETLKPGETKIVDLQVEIRRIKGEPEAIKTEDNAFSRKVTF